MEVTVHCTKDYGRFNFIKGNRPIIPSHIDALVAKNKLRNNLHLFPVICNSKFDIIDGQHRVITSKKLDAEVHYIIDDTVTESDIALFNILSKKWTVVDYINFYTVNEQPGFDILSKFMIDNPLVPPSTCMKMLHGNNTTAALKEGKIQIDYHDRALRISAILKEYSTIIRFAYERNFVLAVLNCVKTKEYDHEEMKRQLEMQSRRVMRCLSVKEYTEMLEEIYNYKKSKNTLKFFIG